MLFVIHLPDVLYDAGCGCSCSLVTLVYIDNGWLNIYDRSLERLELISQCLEYVIWDVMWGCSYLSSATMSLCIPPQMFNFPVDEEIWSAFIMCTVYIDILKFVSHFF